MSTPGNPYAIGNASPHLSAAPNLRLADLGKRFIGALIDMLIGIVFVGPGYALMFMGGFFNPDPEFNPLVIAGLGVTFVGAIALLAAHLYLLITRSQTIGKYLIKTQIVDVRTGRPADFVHAFLLRMLVNGLICGVPCLGTVYAIVDICFIFRADRRCIHDLLASTCVVDIS